MEKTDYELVKEKDYLELWKRYKALCLKFWKILITQLPNEYECFDDFYTDCYEIVMNAANALDLEKMNKEKFCFYIQLYHYLQNFTIRDLVGKHFKSNIIQEDDKAFPNLKDENSEKIIDYLDAELFIEKNIRPILNEKENKKLTSYLNGNKESKISTMFPKIRKKITNI